MFQSSTNSAFTNTLALQSFPSTLCSRTVVRQSCFPFFLLIIAESNTAVAVKCVVRGPYALMFAIIKGSK